MQRLLPFLFLLPSLLAAQNDLAPDTETFAAVDIPVHSSTAPATKASNDPEKDEDSAATESPDDTEAAPVMRRMPVISYELEDIMQNLQDLPANRDRHQRKIDAKKLEDWIKLNPEIGFDPSDDILPYLQYGEARTLFTCGFVQYSVAHPVFNPDAAYVAGIRSVISYYKDNRDILGSDELQDKLVKLQEKGRLSGFIKRRVD